MRTVLSIALILSVGSVASGYYVSFQVDPADIKVPYGFGDVITINLVTDDPDIWSVNIPAIGNTGDHGAAAQPLTLNPGFDKIANAGSVVNQEPVLIESILGESNGTVSNILYSFEYRIPYVPAPLIIVIGDYYDGINWGPAEVKSLSTTYGPQGDATIGKTALFVMPFPEPTTVLLLGLGGLALLRKRR